MDATLKTALQRPQIRLHGSMEQDWIDKFLDGASAANKDAPLVIEVMTTGGDAEVGRRLALEVGLLRNQGREVVFLGKTCVYSSGVTSMSAFRRRERWLTEDCWLLIHERQLCKSITLDGPLDACAAQLRKLTSEIESGRAQERKGFEALATGSALTADDVQKRAKANCYLGADEAMELGLLAGIYRNDTANGEDRAAA